MWNLDLRHVLAVTLLSSVGCCCDHWCCLPDDCVDAFCCTQLGWELQDVCCDDHLSGSCAGCGMVDCSCDVDVCASDCCAAEHRRCVEPGPPPRRYIPPMPPKFLPVPASSIFTGVNMHAPSRGHAQVDVGYGPQLSFPARD